MSVLRHVCGLALVAAATGCSGTSTTSGFGSDGGSDNGSSGSSGGSGSASGSSGSGGVNLGGSGSGSGGGSSSDSGTVTEATTIYAHTDTELYSMDPQTKVVTLVGKFTGLGGGSGDTSVTDLAVDAAGDVYVNSETAIYKAAVPAGGSGSVALTRLATIAAQSGQSFFALGFTPANALGAGTGEVLIGGDGNGELWSINATTGATKDLGSFGPDPEDSSAVLALSGDIVFYAGTNGAATGLASIRSCTTSTKKGSTSSTCDGSTDYLAGIDMMALATAFNGGAVGSLNAGIYGSPAPAQKGSGIGYVDVFGLGVWGGSVYGFTREVTGTPASLLSIATTTGAGTVVPEQVTVSSGWSGAGVTSKVIVSVPPPPAPPK